MDGLGHLDVICGRVGGLHVRDYPGHVRVAGLGQVVLVTRPAGSALDPVAGVEVVRGGQPLAARREVVALPPAHPLLVPVVLLGPGAAQGLDRRDLPQPGRGLGRANSVQQHEAVPADLPGPLPAGIFSLGEPVAIDPGPVAVRPPGVDQRGKPAGGGCGQGFQRRPQRLAHEFHPVQHTHRGQHVRGVSPLPSASAQQPGTRQPRQHHIQDLLFQPMVDQPGPEVPQDSEIEARIIQLQAEQELPVQPGPHLVGGLPVRQPLRVLQHRHQRQRPGRDRGPAHPGEGRSEILVREQRSERLPDPDSQGPPRERSPHHPSRQLRHPIIRSRFQRHLPPSFHQRSRHPGRLTTRICPKYELPNGVLQGEVEVNSSWKCQWSGAG